MKSMAGMVWARKRNDESDQKSRRWRKSCREHVENDQFALVIGYADQEKALPDQDVAADLLGPNQRRVEDVSGEDLNDHDDHDGQHRGAGEKAHDAPVRGQRDYLDGGECAVCLHVRDPCGGGQNKKRRSGGRSVRAGQVADCAIEMNSAIKGDFLFHSSMIGSTFAFMAARSSSGMNWTPFFFKSSRAVKSCVLV
jgi:hypothetical protein